MLTDVYFHRLIINHDSHEFILESGTNVNNNIHCGMPGLLMFHLKDAKFNQTTSHDSCLFLLCLLLAWGGSAQAHEQGSPTQESDSLKHVKPTGCRVTVERAEV
jgi:hypothetical protein